MSELADDLGLPGQQPKPPVPLAPIPTRKRLVMAIAFGILVAALVLWPRDPGSEGHPLHQLIGTWEYQGDTTIELTFRRQQSLRSPSKAHANQRPCLGHRHPRIRSLAISTPTAIWDSNAAVPSRRS